MIYVLVYERRFLGAKNMYKFIQSLSLMTAAVCLLLTACGGIAPGNEENPLGKTLVITPAIKGNSASLNVGDTLEIQIPTIPTAGFEWEVQNLDTDILLQEGSAVYTEDTAPNSAGGIVTLRFKAVGIGETHLSLLYVNSPSDETPALSMRSFGMPVEVK